MNRYIQQLITDLAEAKNHVPTMPDPKEVLDDYPEFERRMLDIEESPDVPMKQLFNVSYQELPPPEKLTTEQMQRLIDAITDTWEAFSISVEFPEGVPTALQYEVMRDEFKEDMHYMPGWSMHQDFCTGWCEDCKIADYCKIKDEVQVDDDFDMKDYINDVPDALPF